MIQVKVHNGDIETALKKLRSIAIPLMKELKGKRFYIKPNEKRREKKRRCLARIRKREAGKGAR